MTKITLLRSAAVGAVLTFGMGAAAHAADAAAPAKPAHHKKAHAAAAKAAENPLAGEVAALKAQLASLEQRLDASTAAAQQAQAAAQQAQASAQAAQSAAQNEQLAINQIPGDVGAAVAKLPKPKTDALYFKGVKITPGGFIEAAGVYRTRGTQSDGATTPGFGSGIPYAGTSTEAAHLGETRFSARQSRLSLLAEADANPNTHLSAYYEMDFLGAGQTANSNESNSYNPRIRNIYATVDFKNYGLSVLAGQSWSLAALNDKGITPRNEAVPLTIDAQYNVGFVWARQPQLRVTENFGHGLWAAVSAELSQTNSPGGTAALQPGTFVTVNSAPYAGGSLFNSLNAYSFNSVPDLIAKVAYDNTVLGRHVHAEGFGLYRDFYDRVGTGCTTTGVNAPALNSAATSTACKSYHNSHTSGGGVGVGFTGEIIPGLLDLRVSDLFGRGVGRYGTSQLSDAFIGSDGRLDGIRENMFLAGLTYHATKALDVYGYFGMEQDSHSSYKTGAVQGGYGNPYFPNSGGCEVAGAFNCTGNVRSLTEATIGLWDKAYSGDFGSFRLGLQYSYFRKESFDGLVNGSTAANPLFGAVSGNDNMIYTSIRYYPFQK